MAITSAGYDGTIDEQQWAGMVSKVGASEYGVDRAGDFAVSAVAGQDRTASVAAGTAWGLGVVDRSDSNITKQLDTIASGSRWDMIVLRRDWQPPGGATTVEVIKGGSSMALPTRNTGNVGVLDDQPIALVQVTAGKTQPTQIIDLRCWARNGGATARHTLARSYLGAIGTTVEINGTVWKRRIGANGIAEWVDMNTVNDTDWATKGFNFVTARSQWTVDGYKIRKKNGRLEGRLWITLRGIPIDGHTNEVTGSVGNFTDRMITTFPEGYRPTAFTYWPVEIMRNGTQQWFGRLQSNGALVITHGIPGGYLDTGDEIVCHLDVPLD